MQLFFSKLALTAASMARYLWNNEDGLETCWRMFKKLRRDQSWKRKVFMRKTQGIKAKTPCLLGRDGDGTGGTDAGQAGWLGKSLAA